MDAIQLRFRGEVIREFPLGERALEVGRGSYCDIVVHDAGVADRELVLRAEGGTVMAYDLRGDAGRPKRSVFPRERPFALGDHHALVRVACTRGGDHTARAGGSALGRALEPVIDPALASVPAPEPTTERIRLDPISLRGFSLVVGGGRSARRFRITEAPLGIGSDPSNEVVLTDRTVSRHHARLESSTLGVTIADLGSRNGTFVDGVRTQRVELARAGTLRVGRTELFVQPDDPRPNDPIVAVSDELRQVLAFVDRVARLPFPVLLLGESGVGKEAIARRVHEASPRARAPFVALNAAGLSPELVESQLFGHERGAFTGASTRHRGVFHQADQGTLFLDEIGELPLDLQSRLLRILETMEVRRVGSETPERVDVRVVCATHRALASMVERGEFRRDLYFRIAQLPVTIPPLRSRPDDIVPTAEHILRVEAPSLGPRTLSRGARSALIAHRWLGNARELRNVLIEACASTTATELELEHVSAVFQRAALSVGHCPDESELAHALALHQGNVTAAARALDMPRSTLRDWVKRGLGAVAPEPPAAAPSGDRSRERPTFGRAGRSARLSAR